MLSTLYYTPKDLEGLKAMIEALKNAGKDDTAEELSAKLPLNSEVIVGQLRREYTPQKHISKKDMVKRVTLADIAASNEYKRHYRKYYSERPKELDNATAAIPLFKAAQHAC